MSRLPRAKPKGAPVPSAVPSMSSHVGALGCSPGREPWEKTTARSNFLPAGGAFCFPRAARCSSSRARPLRRLHVLSGRGPQQYSLNATVKPFVIFEFLRTWSGTVNYGFFLAFASSAFFFPYSLSSVFTLCLTNFSPVHRNVTTSIAEMQQCASPGI